jgi:hypothetical protein
MLMRFHFGLGIGHVYSHHRVSQAEPPHRGVAEQDDGEVEDNYEEAEEDDCAFEGEDGEPRVQGVVPLFGSSNDSLVSQFDEMYGSEVELDYEN